MTSPAEKIKEHLDQWQKLEIMKEKAPYSSLRDSYAEELEDFTRNNSATHRKAIEKLVDALKDECICAEGNNKNSACYSCHTLVDVAEMLSGGGV